MAAGLTIQRDKIPDFRSRFELLARQQLGLEDLGPEQRVDLVITLADADAELERMLAYLEPCGMGNPAPVFGVQGAKITGLRVVGGQHLRGRLEQGGNSLEAIGFGMAETGLPSIGMAATDIAFRLELNQFQGVTTLQARLLTVNPHTPLGE